MRHLVLRHDPLENPPLSMHMAYALASLPYPALSLLSCNHKQLFGRPVSLFVGGRLQGAWPTGRQEEGSEWPCPQG